MKRCLYLAAVLAAIAAGLLLPGWLRLSAVLPALLSWLIGPDAAPEPDDGWEVTASPDACVVCIDEALLFDPPQYTALARLPFEELGPDRFRTRPAAMLLSAAASLTADLAGDALPNGALAALNIRPDNIRRQYPLLAPATLGQAQGCIVQDGRGQRAFFVGDASLSESCAAVYDRTERPFAPGDQQAAAQLPGLHYATAPIADGKPGPAVYLGSLLPQRIEVPNAEAIAALHRLLDAHLSVVCPQMTERLRAARLPVAAAEDSAAILVRRLSARDNDFASPVMRRLAAQGQLTAARVRMTASAIGGAALAACAGAFLVWSGAALTAPVAAAFLGCAAALALLPALWAAFSR